MKQCCEFIRKKTHAVTRAVELTEKLELTDKHQTRAFAQRATMTIMINPAAKKATCVKDGWAS